MHFAARLAVLVSLFALPSFAQVSPRKVSPSQQALLLERIHGGFWATTEFFGIDKALERAVDDAVRTSLEKEVLAVGARNVVGGAGNANLRVRVELPAGLQGGVLVQLSVTQEAPDCLKQRLQGQVLVLWESPVALVKADAASITAAATEAARRALAQWKSTLPPAR